MLPGLAWLRRSPLNLSAVARALGLALWTRGVLGNHPYKFLDQSWGRDSRRRQGVRQTTQWAPPAAFNQSCIFSIAPLGPWFSFLKPNGPLAVPTDPAFSILHPFYLPAEILLTFKVSSRRPPFPLLSFISIQHSTGTVYLILSLFLYLTFCFADNRCSADWGNDLFSFSPTLVPVRAQALSSHSVSLTMSSKLNNSKPKKLRLL